MKVAFIVVALAACFAATQARLSARETQAVLATLPPHARQLLQVSAELTAQCSMTAARNCGIAHAACIQNAGGHSQDNICSCFQTFGNCLHLANCLNGTNEDLNTQYCQTVDSYCCDNHGEFAGCGERADFSGSEMCWCEEGYSGTFCNTTDSVCSTDLSTCNVCGTCCKSYSQDTCDACVQEECDMNVCSADSSCSVCSACCKSYLSGNQADCNVCVEDECSTSVQQSSDILF